MAVSRKQGYVKKVRGCNHSGFGTVLDNIGTQISLSVSLSLRRKS